MDMASHAIRIRATIDVGTPRPRGSWLASCKPRGTTRMGRDGRPCDGSMDGHLGRCPGQITRPGSQPASQRGGPAVSSQGSHVSVGGSRNPGGAPMPLRRELGRHRTHAWMAACRLVCSTTSVSQACTLTGPIPAAASRGIAGRAISWGYNDSESRRGHCSLVLLLSILFFPFRTCLDSFCLVLPCAQALVLVLVLVLWSQIDAMCHVPCVMLCHAMPCYAMPCHALVSRAPPASTP
jgi:hypothetical protein